MGGSGGRVGEDIHGGAVGGGGREAGVGGDGDIRRLSRRPRSDPRFKMPIHYPIRNKDAPWIAGHVHRRPIGCPIVFLLAPVLDTKLSLLLQLAHCSLSSSSNPGLRRASATRSPSNLSARPPRPICRRSGAESVLDKSHRTRTYPSSPRPAGSFPASPSATTFPSRQKARDAITYCTTSIVSAPKPIATLCHTTSMTTVASTPPADPLCLLDTISPMPEQLDSLSFPTSTTAAGVRPSRTPMSTT